MKLLLIIVIGVVAGIIDILPMLKMKIDRYSTASAFVFHLIAPFFVYAVSAFIPFWLGGAVYVVLALPVLILVAKEDKKSVPIMAVSSLVIGTIAGLLLGLL